MALLNVEHLSLTYKGETLLHDVSLALNGGEILSLLGPSGSGKTTLLRLLAGLETPDQGRFFFDGRDMAVVPAHRRSFGMMFQEYALFPHMNVIDNVAFGLKVQGISEKARRQRVEEILHMAGLEGYEQRRVDCLSGGERQRVALARSLAPQPRLLLLDEPLAALDRSLRDHLAGEIRAILKSLRITAIFVTHDQSEAFAVADKIAILDEGQLEQFGTPEEVYRRPRNLTVATFLGFRNLIAADHDGIGTVHTALGRWQGIASSQGPGKDGWLLIRPDGARLASSSEGEVDQIIVRGEVIKRQFQGRSYQVVMTVEGQSLCFDLPLDPSPPEAGELVVLHLSPDSMIWLDNPRRNV